MRDEWLESSPADRNLWLQAQYKSGKYPGIQEGKLCPEVCQTYRHGAQGHGLVADLSVLSLQLDLIILKVFSYLK